MPKRTSKTSTTTRPTSKKPRPGPASSIIDELLPGFSERSRQGRRNRQKGAEYERDVAAAFQALFAGARREHGQSRDGGDAADVEGTPFWIECTKGEASIYDKLEQGLVDATKAAMRLRNDPRTKGKVSARPVIVCSRRNGKRTRHIVTMDRDQFIDLLMEWQHGRLF